VVKTAVWNAEGVTEDVAVYDKSEGAIPRVFCIYGKGKYCYFDFHRTPNLSQTPKCPYSIGHIFHNP